MRNRNWLSLTLGLIILNLIWLVGCRMSPNPQGEMAQVQRVINGHTVEVVFPSHTPALIERVRLIGIEAPDLQQQPWGSAAKTQLEELLKTDGSGESAFQSVLLETDHLVKDSYGRHLAYVWNEELLLNEQLVREGYVFATSSTSNNKYHQRLLYAQEYARLMGLGIWDTLTPMRLTPQEFRAQD